MVDKLVFAPDDNFVDFSGDQNEQMVTWSQLVFCFHLLYKRALHYDKTISSDRH